MKTDWHKQVYRKTNKMSKVARDEWRKTRKACLERDHYTCYRCGKHSATGQGLSIHHLTPREKGGENDLDNLITLCHKCHDLAEIAGAYTLDAIRILEGGEPTEQPILKQIEGRQEAFDRPDWHKWVYGGERRPQ